LFSLRFELRRQNASQLPITTQSNHSYRVQSSFPTCSVSVVFGNR
jgi:hypothetical protein